MTRTPNLFCLAKRYTKFLEQPLNLANSEMLIVQASPCKHVNATPVPRDGRIGMDFTFSRHTIWRLMDAPGFPAGSAVGLLYNLAAPRGVRLDSRGPVPSGDGPIQEGAEAVRRGAGRELREPR